MTTDRKRYSRRREQAIWNAVDKEITEFRIKVLKGELESVSAVRQEDKIYRILSTLADKVAAEYRRSYAKENPPS